MKTFILAVVAILIAGSSAAKADYQYYPNQHRTRPHWETECKKIYMGRDYYGRPIYHNRCRRVERY